MDYFDHVTRMSWRLEAILQTRANLVKKAEPIVTIELEMESENLLVFETQPEIIELLTEEMDKSLKLMKGKDARRLQKCI